MRELTLLHQGERGSVDFQPREKCVTLLSPTCPAFCHTLPGLTALLLREGPTTVSGERRVSALAMCLDPGTQNPRRLSQLQVGCGPVWGSLTLPVLPLDLASRVGSTLNLPEEHRLTLVNKALPNPCLGFCLITHSSSLGGSLFSSSGAREGSQSLPEPEKALFIMQRDNRNQIKAFACPRFLPTSILP